MAGTIRPRSAVGTLRKKLFAGATAGEHVHMAGDFRYKQICVEMKAAGFMNDPIAKVMRYRHRIREWDQALFKSRTYKAFKMGERPEFPNKTGLPRFRLVCPHLRNRNVIIEVDRESGLIRNVRSGKVGFLEDVDDPDVMVPVE